MTAKMTRTQAIELFGNENRTAVALGISRQAVNTWPEELGLSQISKIVTGLMMQKRKAEAGEIIKRYLDGKQRS